MVIIQNWWSVTIISKQSFVYCEGVLHPRQENQNTPRGNPEFTHHPVNSKKCSVTTAGKKGHFARVCRNEKKKTTKGPGPGTREHKQVAKSKPTHLVKDIAGEDDLYVESVY